jgi:ABC-type antimicrobial peptide transport system permease subunit
MLAFALAQRQRELGVRLALGATPAGLVSLVMSDSARLVALGLLVGLPASIAAARWTQAFVPGAAGSDPLTLAAAGALTALIALAASYLPAHRASKVNPTSALREG